MKKSLTMIITGLALMVSSWAAVAGANGGTGKVTFLWYQTARPPISETYLVVFMTETGTNIGLSGYHIGNNAELVTMLSDAYANDKTITMDTSSDANIQSVKFYIIAP